MIQESGAKAAALGIVPVICVLLYMFEHLDYTQLLFLAVTSQYFTQFYETGENFLILNSIWPSQCKMQDQPTNPILTIANYFGKKSVIFIS